MSEQRWRLIADDDGHWYLCPSGREEEARKMLDAVSAYWDEELGDTPPPMPDFVNRIDGPESVTFSDPQED